MVKISERINIRSSNKQKLHSTEFKTNNVFLSEQSGWIYCRGTFFAERSLECAVKYYKMSLRI